MKRAIKTTIRFENSNFQVDSKYYEEWRSLAYYAG